MEEDRELIMEFMRLSRRAPSQQSSSSSPSPPLQEEQVVDQPPMSPPLPTQTPPSSTTARSIRCKNNSETGDTTQKRKRGVVTGAKAAKYLQTTGQKIKVEYDEFHKGPADPKIRDMISRAIGSCVRASVPMEAPSYKELDEKHRKIVEKHLLVHYHIPVDHVGLWDYVQTTAALRYKDWKYDCKQHWLKYKEEVPLEFLHRRAQWEWLCTHFNDPKNVELSKKMKSVRSGPNRMNHHSGPTAFSCRAQQHALVGHAAPLVAAFKDAYANDPIGATHVEVMEHEVQKWSTDHLDSEDGEAMSVATQLNVITARVGERKGTTYRGCGRHVTREPKKRGSVSRVDVDAIVEAKLEERMKEKMAAMQEQVQQQVAAAMAKLIEKQAQMQEDTTFNDNPSPSPSNS